MSAREPGDWMCMSCNSPRFNFKSRKTCRDCGAKKNVVATADSSIPKREAGDWMCGVCNSQRFNFKSRTTCRDCGADKNQSPATVAMDTVESKPLQDFQATKECVVCMDAQKQVVLPCGHYDLCNNCAVMLTSCPVCKAKYDRSKILKVFES